MIRRAIFLGLLLAGLLCVGAPDRCAAAPARGSERWPRLTAATFPRPPELAATVRFWTKVFTTFSARQVVVHDATHVEKIYAVLSLGSAGDEEAAAAIEAEKEEVRSLLLRLHRKKTEPHQLSARERKIFELLRSVNEPNLFRAAAERVRAQAGLRERFAAGLRISRRYLPSMERIFADAGLPVELARLPLIESAFAVEAYSRKGAAGIWQFLPGTGRLHGLRIDRLFDQRRDPILATEAAARYLAAAHEALGSWPLAVTAYNQGIRRMNRAVRTVGSGDLAEIIERFEDGSFGFAGRNFYAEFVAALDIDSSPELYFGALDYERPIDSEEVRLSRPLALPVAAQAAGLEAAELAALNPACGSRIIQGAVALPRGYRLRIPTGRKQAFELHVAALSSRRALAGVLPDTHTVRSGQTLSHVAHRYGTTVAALKQANGIRNADMVRVGQLIQLPVHDDGAGRTRTHRVRRGQTLSRVAQLYGTTVGTLKRRNLIRDADMIRTGQVIEVPARPNRGAGYLRHSVRRGETLSDIAVRYGVTVAVLSRRNRIGDPRRLRAGQIVVVPLR